MTWNTDHELNMSNKEKVSINGNTNENA